MASGMTQYQAKEDRKKLIERLLTKPMSCHEVAALTGFAKPSVNKYLMELYDAGRIHIGAWRLCERSKTKLYLAGHGEDALAPDRFKRAEESEDDGGFKRPPVNIEIRRDALVAAFFGDPA